MGKGDLFGGEGWGWPRQCEEKRFMFHKREERRKER